MRITIIHPAIGHRKGEPYIRSWQMEPLPAAVIAGLTPADVEVRYNDVPFKTTQLQPEEITRLCVQSRKRFYSFSSIFRRGISATNRADGFMFRQFFPINLMHARDINKRNGYPLGDETWSENLIPATC